MKKNEKISEKIQIAKKWYFLSQFRSSPKFNEKKKYFADYDLRIFDTICLDECAISEYTQDDNFLMATEFVRKASVMLGKKIEDDMELEILGNAVLGEIKQYDYLNWSELELATEIALNKNSKHPLRDTFEYMDAPQNYNFPFFSFSISLYMKYRKNLHTLINRLDGEYLPYRIEKTEA